MPKLLESKISFNLPAVMQQTDYLRGIIEQSMTAAVQAGAQVFYEEVKGRASRMSDAGTLAASIYQWRDPFEQRPGHARYKISWRKNAGRAEIKTKAGRQEGSGLPLAAHGQLIEYGWIQRYAVHKAKDGQWYTIVQAKNRGKKAPWIGKGKRGRNKRPTREQLDDWYMLRPGGPVQHLPRSFLRAGYEAAKDRALAAASKVMIDKINAGML